MKSSVCFIMPYFGKLPDSFPYWLNCCKNNPDFNWLILTDDRTQYDLPQNVTIRYTTLQNIKDHVEEKFEWCVPLEKPYKLCDYKPLYGWLFDEELKGFTHWGYGDMDLLLGQLSSFITDDMLMRYAKISKLGHLSILQNSPEINSAFKDCSYKEIFQSPRIATFDEVRFEPNINSILEQKGKKVLKTLPYADIAQEHYNFHRTEYRSGNRTSYCKYVPTVYRYLDGKLFKVELMKHEIVQTEIAYAHFQKREIAFPKELKSRYMLVPNKIIDDVSLDEAAMKEFCKDDIRYTVSKFSSRVKRAIKSRL